MCGATLYANHLNVCRSSKRSQQRLKRLQIQIWNVSELLKEHRDIKRLGETVNVIWAA